MTANNDFTAGTAFASIAITGPGYTLTGNSIVLSSTPVPSLAVSTASGTTAIGIGIAGSGASVIVNAVNGVVTLSGANSYTGQTAVNGGILRAGSATAFGNGNALNVNAGTLDLNINNITAASLAGAAGAVVTATGAAGVSTLTLTAQSTTYNGVFNDGTRALALNLTNPANIFMSGASNYSGGTTITPLTRVVPRNSLAFGVGPVTVQATGQVYIDSSGGPYTLLNNFSIIGDGAGAGGDPAPRGAIRGDGGSTVAGSVTLNANASLGSFSGTGIFTGPITGGFNLGINLEATNVGTVILANSANNYTGATTVGATGTVGASNLQLGNGGSTGALPAGTSITLNGTTTLIFARTDNGLNMGQVISGTGSINQNGTGTTFITGINNSYTGLTQINSGTLNVASIANYGVNCSIGARLASQETATGNGIGIWFSNTAGATLQYTGSTAQSTNRQIRMRNSTSPTPSCIIDASGSVPHGQR